MDIYAFCRETTDAGLRQLFGLVDEGVARFAMPMAGEYTSYAAIRDDDPGQAMAKFRQIAALDGLVGVEAFVGVVPLDAEKNPEATSDRYDGSSLSRAASDPPPLPPNCEPPLCPPPIGPVPTWGFFEAWIAQVLLTCEPGTTTQTYVKASALPGLVGLAVVHGPAPLVLVELAAASEGSLAVAVDLAGTIDAVESLSTSIGHASTVRRTPDDTAR